MCWCRPEVRTPNCGSANCMPREKPEDRPKPKLPPKKGVGKTCHFPMSLDNNGEYLLEAFTAALEQLGIEHDSDCSLNIIIQRIDKS